MLDIWGITIAALVDRDVIDGDRLRRRVTEQAQSCHNGQGLRADQLRTFASNISAMIAGAQRAKEFPPAWGTA